MPTDFGPNNNNFPLSERITDLDVDNDDALWDLLSVYLDGEATPEEARLVEAMLRDDPAYARSFAMMKAASDTMQGLPEVEPPVSLRDSIFAATVQRPTLARRVAAGWERMRAALAPATNRYALPASALAVTLLAAFLVWPRDHQKAPPIPSDRVAGAMDVARPPIHTHIPILGPDKVTSRNTTASVGTNNTKPQPTPPENPNVENPVIAPVKNDTKIVRGSLPNGPKPDKPAPTNAPKNNQVANNTKPNSPNPFVTEDITPNSAPFKPAMDSNNQRPMAMVKEPKEVVPDLPHSMPEEGTRIGDGGAPGPETPTAPAPRKLVAAALIRNQVPSELLNPRSTNSQLRRDREYETGGYDRQTVESIKRREVTVTLISGKL